MNTDVSTCESSLPIIFGDCGGRSREFSLLTSLIESKVRDCAVYFIDEDNYELSYDAEL